MNDVTKSLFLSVYPFPSLQEKKRNDKMKEPKELSKMKCNTFEKLPLLQGHVRKMNFGVGEGEGGEQLVTSQKQVRQ